MYLVRKKDLSFGLPEKSCRDQPWQEINLSDVFLM